MAEALDGGDVTRRVQSRKLLIGGDAWVGKVGGTRAAHQSDGRPEATRCQRMVGAEVVFEVRVAVDDERLAGHSASSSCASEPACSQPVALSASRHASAGA